LFLQAEAAAKGLIPGSAATFYNEGIASSFEADAVPNADAAAATYAAQPAIAYPTGGSIDAQVQAIITQKWAALAIYGSLEAFNENRRTGFPAVPTSIFTSANAPNQVERIFYPFLEYETNAANVAAEGTINPFSSKIFWAK
jgi:Starch-binding associating with outer membrane